MRAAFLEVPNYTLGSLCVHVAANIIASIVVKKYVLQQRARGLTGGKMQKCVNEHLEVAIHHSTFQIEAADIAVRKPEALRHY
jgi:hypothetical protein